MTGTAILTALAFWLAPTAPDAPVGGNQKVETWVEVPLLYMLNPQKVQVTDLTVKIGAAAKGMVSYRFEYKLQNSGNALTVEAVLPLSYEIDDPFIGSKVRIDSRREGLSATLEKQPVNITRKAWAGAAAFPGSTEADVLTFALDNYQAAVLVIQLNVPWGQARAPRFCPEERGFSINLAGMSTYDPPIQTLDVTMAFSPALLGPASIAQPRPYKYTSHDLDWNFVNLGSQEGQTPPPPRIAVRVFERWANTGFEGVLYAYWEAVPGDEYVWNKQFLWLSPVAGDQQSLITPEAIDKLKKYADSIVNEILARNGATFNDTFVQMNYQQQPWYKPKAGFSEDGVLPVEKWNLNYARCIQRAVRTAVSMLSKTGNQAVDAKSSLFRMVTRPFSHCDQLSWNPLPKQQLDGGLIEE